MLSFFQEVLSVQFKAEDIRPKLEAAVAQLKESGKEWEDPVLLGASDAKRVFLSPRVVDGVLPGKTIIQDWVPYRPLESNLKKLVSQDFIWMADDKEEPTVLSVGTAPYRVPLGTGYHRLNIDIFGKQFPRARNQLLAQLQQGVSTLEVPIYCLLYFEPSMWQDMLSFCQTALGLHKDRDFEGQNLLEADILSVGVGMSCYRVIEMYSTEPDPSIQLIHADLLRRSWTHDLKRKNVQGHRDEMG
eukprot:g39200.t1